MKERADHSVFSRFVMGYAPSQLGFQRSMVPARIAARASLITQPDEKCKSGAGTAAKPEESSSRRT